MQFIKILCILFLTFAFACGANENKPYWKEEKLVRVLADLRIIDGQIKKHLHEEKDSLRIYYKEILYDIHDISEEDMIHHLKYVQNDPDIAQDLEKKIQKLLSDRLTEIQNYQ